ncbi:MAG TPA: hypothetical protein VF780_09905 [Nitrosospira sp.]
MDRLISESFGAFTLLCVRAMPAVTHHAATQSTGTHLGPLHNSMQL